MKNHTKLRQSNGNCALTILYIILAAVLVVGIITVVTGIITAVRTEKLLNRSSLSTTAVAGSPTTSHDDQCSSFSKAIGLLALPPPLLTDDGHRIDLGAGDPEIHRNITEACHPCNKSPYINDTLDGTYISGWKLSLFAFGSLPDDIVGFNARRGRFILPTDGSMITKAVTEGLFGLLLAITQVERGNVVYIACTSTPYYGTYTASAALASPTGFTFYNPNATYAPNSLVWVEPSQVPVLIASGKRLTIEICTSPNNPDGRVQTLQWGAKYGIYDVVYDEPIYTGLIGQGLSVNGNSTLGADVTAWLTSESKCKGFGNGRQGIVVIHNVFNPTTFYGPNFALWYNLLFNVLSSSLDIVYNTYKMSRNWYIEQSTAQGSWSAQKPCQGSWWFDHLASAIMTNRRQQWLSAVPAQYQLSADSRAPYFFVDIPAITFARPELNIVVSNGAGYGDSPLHTRVMLLRKPEDWNLAIQRLRNFFADPVVASQKITADRAAVQNAAASGGLSYVAAMADSSFGTNARQLLTEYGVALQANRPDVVVQLSQQSAQPY